MLSCHVHYLQNFHKNWKLRCCYKYFHSGIWLTTVLITECSVNQGSINWETTVYIWSYEILKSYDFTLVFTLFRMMSLISYVDMKSLLFIVCIIKLIVTNSHKYLVRWISVRITWSRYVHQYMMLEGTQFSNQP